jgi:hypothetical protein
VTTRTPAAASTSVNYHLAGTAGTVWLGLGPAQVAGLAATVLLAVGLLLAHAPLAVTVVVTTVGAGASAWPVAGRTGLQWLPRLCRHAAARFVGADRWHLAADEVSAAVLLGPAARPDMRQSSGPPRPVRLGVGNARVLVQHGTGDVAVVDGRRRSTVTVVLVTTPTGRFGLLDPAGQDGALQQWGVSLATLLHLPGVRQVQWLAHSGPDTPLPPARPPLADDEPLLHDQMLLLAAAHGQARRHTQLLAITIAAHTDHHRHHRTAELNRTAELSRAARDLAHQSAAALLGADILSYPLSAPELIAQLRQILDPTRPVDRKTGADPAETTDPADAVSAPALSGRECWTHCALDDTLHRAFAVTGWPRASLRADWLAPLLQHPPAVGTGRTLTVQARPVPPAQAARRARASAAKARLDAADRQRLGFTSGPATALDEVDAEQTEAELVAGYRLTDVTALLTLHAPDLLLLDAATADLRTAALTHRLDLRPLHGQHQTAVHASLPLGLPLGGRS